MNQADRFTRRGVLAALAGGAALPAFSYKPRIAAAFYIWSQQFNQRKTSLADGVAEALAATRRAGYRRVELMSIFLRPGVLENTLKALKANKLELASVYNGGAMHTAADAEKSIADTLQIAAIARKAGARWLNFNPSPKPRKERKTDAELEAQAQYINALAGKLELQGLRLHLHHHDPEMMENAREWRHVLAKTDAKRVFFCLDLDWVHRGGQDPMELMRLAGPRLASLHLRNSKAGIWTEDLSQGDIDHGKVASYLKQSGFQGLLIVELGYHKETQITRPLEENLRLSRVFLEKTF